MLIKIDIEVWMVILDWLGKGYRRELAAKVNQLGDSTFCGICQTWLHKYTKNVQLGFLGIKSEVVFNKDGKEEERGMLEVCGTKGRNVKVPFADVQMPENVMGFGYIQISYLDSGVLNFLRLMPALVSSNHTKKELSVESKDEDDPDPSDNDLAITRTALGHLLPLFSNGSLASISFESMTASFLGSIIDQCPEQLFSAKLLSIDDVINLPIIPSIVRWLCTKRADAEPRLAYFYANWKNDDTIFAVYETIRQQFLAATSPVSFFIKIATRFGTAGFQFQGKGTPEKNSTTGEQLIWCSSSRIHRSIGRWTEKHGWRKWQMLLDLMVNRGSCFVHRSSAQWKMTERKMRNPMPMAVVSSKKRRQN